MTFCLNLKKTLINEPNLKNTSKVKITFEVFFCKGNKKMKLRVMKSYSNNVL